jgi:HlyD family secretion protein
MEGPAMSEGRGAARLRRVGWIAGGGVALILGAALVFRGLTADLRPDGEDPAARFRHAPVRRGDLRETIVASGTMEPLVRVPVIAEVSGIIATVHVEEGDRVRRGQPLFELDRERLEARVAERRAALELRAANARYDLVGRAAAERDRARRDLERISELRERDVASSLELENLEHELRLAEIALHDAHAETAARRAAVKQVREMLRQAERDLANAVVRAPIDGVVIERDGEIGRAIADVTSSGGTVIAVIADDRRIRLIAEVDENDIAQVRVGQDARVSIDAFPDETFPGRVQKVSSSGTVVGNISNFEVEIRLEPTPRLRVGMSSDARIVVREHRGVLLIPNTAIVRRDAGTLVRVPDVGGGGAYHLSPVETGFSDGFRTVISEGLQEGDVILIRSDGAGG